jgi:hypothetical protein
MAMRLRGDAGMLWAGAEAGVSTQAINIKLICHFRVRRFIEPFPCA